MPNLRFVRLGTAALLVVSAVGAFAGPVAATADARSDAERAMVDVINADRRAAGLKALAIDTTLMGLARARSDNMATYHYFSHTQPNGKTVFDMIKASKIQWSLAGEVIAWASHTDVTDAMNAGHTGWMNSSGHRAVLMGSRYNRIGIGATWDTRDKRWYWTGVLIEGAPVTPPPAPTPQPGFTTYVGVRVRDGGEAPGGPTEPTAPTTLEPADLGGALELELVDLSAEPVAPVAPPPVSRPPVPAEPAIATGKRAVWSSARSSQLQPPRWLTIR